MERLALDDLIRWNKSANRKPLIVWGARQTGKSYLIKELFAKTFYKNKSANLQSCGCRLAIFVNEQNNKI